MTVGDIWYTSWGYDQTNVEFFESVRETDATITLRRITSEVRDNRVWPLPGEYTVDFLLRGSETRWNQKKKQSEPNPAFAFAEARGYSEKVCRKGKYGSLKIDTSRRAYPYEGGGKYDTYAAGGTGH